MAEIVVTYLIDKLIILLAQEKVLQKEVHGEIKFIKDELESMTAFFRAVDARKDSEEAVKVWVKQLRDIAFDIEGILDESILVGISHNHRQQTFIGSLQNFMRYIKSMKERHSLANEIQEIKEQVLQISDRSKRYVFANHCLDQQGSSSSNPWDDLRQDAVLLDEADLVGIQGPKKDLIEYLVKEPSRFGVVSIVGMGGLGKTTIAKKVYDDPEIKKHFKPRAWISVTQNFNLGTILKDLIKQIFRELNQSVPPEVKEKEDIPELKGIVRDLLKEKRYVIALDDIWSIQAWDAVMITLPDYHCGSRVLVTTRFSDFASYFTKSYGHIYDLARLSHNESWTLFCRKAFGKSPYGLEFVELSKKILSRCECLPLGIVSIAGLLATKGLNYMEWEMVYRSLGEEIEHNDILENMKKILMLSFTDLPYNLKACFMYISLFPEGHLIKCRKLIRLWIAEGFVEETEGRTVEEVSESFLTKLINRNLLHVAMWDRGGKPKRCQVHDLMREIILSKCREDQFSAVITDRSKKIGKKFRHLSIQDYGESAVLQDDYSLFYNRIRSLFLFRINKSSDSPIPKKFFTGFRLLRVIDLKAQPLELFPSELLNLFHLRYLGLRRTKIKMLPNSIGKLQNLETLDLKHSEVSELPAGIFKLQKLRYLLIHRYNINAPYSPFNFSKGFTTNVGISSLKSLQKLSFIEVNQGQEVIKELGSLKQLTRLNIGKLTKKDGKLMCSSLEKMNKLRSLNVSARDEDDILDLESLSSPPPLLQRLVLRGTLAKLPSWISSLRHLVRISLKWAGLNESPLESLQELPNLVDLDLYHAFAGDLLCFKAGGFPKLNVLNLNTLEGLKRVDFEEGAVLLLEKLYIVCCPQLQSVPFGMARLTNLKDLRFYDMSEDFIKRMQGSPEIMHIPEIHALVWKSKWEYLSVGITTLNMVDGQKFGLLKHSYPKLSKQ